VRVWLLGCLIAFSRTQRIASSLSLPPYLPPSLLTCDGGSTAGRTWSRRMTSHSNSACSQHNTNIGGGEYDKVRNNARLCLFSSISSLSPL